MTWSDRLKTTFRTFKNIAIPLYIWYLLYAFIIFASFFVALIPLGIIAFILFGNTIFTNNFQLDSNFTHLSTSSLPFDNNLWPYYSMFHNTGVVVFIILSILAMIILGLIAGSIFHAGIINLVRKGLHTKAFFGDFSPKGAMRILKWNMSITFSLIILFLLAFIFLGILGDTASFSRVIFVFYFVGVGLLSIFLSPWLASGSIYILVRDDLTFSKALKASWSFFRRNMQSLWGLLLTCILFAIVISIIQNYTNDALRILINFITSPFMTIIPIVWTLTLMQEREVIILDEEDKAAPVEAPIIEDDNSPSNFTSDEQPSNLPEDKMPNAKQSDAKQADDKLDDAKLDYNKLANDKLADDKPANSEMNYCPICGQSISSEQAIYCSKCGTKIR